MTTLSRRLLFVISCCLGLMGTASGQDGLGALVDQANSATQPEPQAPRRAAVPSTAASRQALAELKDIFKDDYAKATTPPAKLALARQLLAQAEKTPALSERWVLHTESMRLASDAGDMELVFQTIAVSATQFDVDADELKLDALAKLATKAPPQEIDGLARTALAIAKQAADSKNSTLMPRSLALASGLARKARNRALIAEAAKLQQSARDQERESKEMAAITAKISQNPSDPDICLEAGRFFCFKADDWERGLPLLAKGSDTDLARLAVAELNAPQAPEAVLSLGDAWWDWADDERSVAKAAATAHAADLYGSVLAKTQGLDRARLEKRIKQARSESPDRGRRMPLADLKEESATGIQYGLTKDGTFRGKPFICCGQTWPKGMQAMTQPSGTSIRFRIPPGAKRLVGRAGVFGPDGVSPLQQPAAPLHFEILVDGISSWKSPPLPKRDDTATFSVELAGAGELELRTTCPSDSSAWSAWLDPELVF